MQEIPSLNALSHEKLVNRMVDKALPIVRSGIKESDFNYADTPGDIEYVKKMKRIFQENDLKESQKDPEAYFHRVLAKVFEALVIDQIAQSEWFGRGLRL